jgi:probable F420-dependent oxidoreductase
VLSLKVFARLDGSCPLGDVADAIHRIEALGYDGVHISETIHDPFTVAALSVVNSTSLVVRTSVALAFVRSPLLTAYAAWDLSRLSGGRFHLGLGTQIRQNIEDRYGMPWSAPTPRMGEYIDILECAFASFRSGVAPRFEGEHYRLTRLQPAFNPGPDAETATPPIWLGGVNRYLCQLAGAKAAGFMAHSTNSHPRYLRELCIPNLARGARAVGRAVGEIQIVAGAPFITGRTSSEVMVERELQRRALAFLCSTPAYRPTLELCGFSDLHSKLLSLVRMGNWDSLANVITDDVLEEILPSTTYQHLPDLVRTRLLGLVDGLVLQVPRHPVDDGEFREVVTAIQAMS